jgi:hypothetical protein
MLGTSRVGDTALEEGVSVEIAKLIVQQIFSIRGIGVVIGGLVCCVLCVLVFGWPLGALVPLSAFPYVQIHDQRITLILTGTSFVFASLFLLTKSRADAEDIYTPLRKELNGNWRISYDSFKHDDRGKVELERPFNVATLGIDSTTRKMFMDMTLSQTDFFKEEPVRIADISINPGVNPHRLVYYHILKRHVRDDVTKNVGPLEREVIGPIAAILEFQRNTVGKIDTLDGHWYDLDEEFSGANERFAKLEASNNNLEKVPRRGGIKFERVG